MLLVIDVGNTNIVFAVHDGQDWLGTWRIATTANRTSDEYAATLLVLMEKQNIPVHMVTRAIIGTVVPPVLYQLLTLCRKWFFVDPIVASADLDWGFEIQTDNPQEVGVDRLLNGLAAHQLYGGPLVVVDLGTATTFDIVDKDGNYCGGVISPGLTLSLEALHSAAARLPRIGFGRPQSVIGKETIGAMKSGIYWGYIGLIEGIIERIRKEYSVSEMTVVGTGGLARLLAEGTPIFKEINAELTLEGLRILANRNSSGNKKINKI
ncbi:Pantothenate kinase type III (CoaX) (PDB:2F9T) [Commensalibacter communis]|uniref:type III pantothenate kinase n=1 Tax=Commensalibacter communis TaxID=2972786 RepID=UPI0022FF8A23|nr:type III pantothenate kinase [Commensalibacter communis]CAI3925144.1 Pantothenate kinase type III (CoaX) (PDB:2F9T) [Commensalibacter communis]CAI3934003.1 Pantothenate kinase type III (CoaX) (PDB:2F9T) [Commensalibacter communis]